MEQEAKQHLVSPMKQKAPASSGFPRATEVKHPLVSPMKQKAKHP